ncbi:hypothetical protein [Kitasatospora griseola]|uniref:hypothetical protein n=1 Tax=Kitasatospora griseola TaxID=2064 RepID=UPI0037F96D21
MTYRQALRQRIADTRFFEEFPVVVSASLAFVFGVAALLLRRSGAFTLTTGLVLALFGFTLASTGLGPTINQFLAGLVHLLGSIRF